MNIYNQYDESKDIANLLEQEGLYERAKQITDAMIEGSTGNEIYMILRSRLKSLIDKENFPMKVKDKANNLYLSLNSIL
ncbi:MAG: hypothetical protein LBL59_03815 [Xanthomonadaceae bacterium]|jgi:hypothetical protein|nr:hypothetical protein [Xanthomonadaceae bacterium]